MWLELKLTNEKEKWILKIKILSLTLKAYFSLLLVNFNIVNS